MMNKHMREWYIPTGASELRDIKSDAVVFVAKNARGTLHMVGFSGNAQKPRFNYTFKDADRAGRYAKVFFESWRDSLIRKAAFAEARKAKNAKRKLQVGHILRTCWGYDQTNVEFFQVTKLVGAHSVEVREIGQSREATAWAQGTCLPVLDKFIGEPIIKRDLDGAVKFASYRWAHIWEGQPAHWSAYA